MRTLYLSVIASAILLASMISCEKNDSGTVIGTVIDADTKLPLSGVKVTIANVADVTPQDGTYRLNGVRVGKQTIITQLAGYITDSQVIDVFENSVVTFDIQLKRIGSIRASGVLSREGNQKIDVGPGPTPQISWTGGSIYRLVVYHWDNIKGEWILIWAIAGELNGHQRPEDIIVSPITYGITPPNATESFYSLEYVNPVHIHWVFETFRPGEKYKIEITQRTEGTSTLYFVR